MDMVGRIVVEFGAERERKLDDAQEVQAWWKIRFTHLTDNSVIIN